METRLGALEESGHQMIRSRSGPGSPIPHFALAPEWTSPHSMGRVRGRWLLLRRLEADVTELSNELEGLVDAPQNLSDLRATARESIQQLHELRSELTQGEPLTGITPSLDNYIYLLS